jgi:Nucleotidyltransferase domain
MVPHFLRKDVYIRMTLSIPVEQLVQRFDAPGVRAIVLMGSYARGEAGPYSDIDVVRFTGEQEVTGASSYLFDGRLVVVSNVAPGQVERWFSEPEVVTDTVMGIRRARALLDRDGYFAAIRQRAEAFEWDQAMQERANRRASAALVGWIEEAHKGLAGLQRNDVGRLLQARYGLSWGLSRVMKVQRGVLISGDNAFYDEVARAMAHQPAWMRLNRAAFGIEGEDGRAPSLSEQVQAGLRLYILTAELLAPVLQAEDRPLITHTIELIREALA